MKSIAKIFWNSHDRRFRAGWRLVLQLLIWLIVVIAFLLGVKAVAVAAEIVTPAEYEDWEIIVESVATLPAIWLGGRLLDRRRFAEFGFHINKDWLIDFGFGLFLGGFLISVVFLIALAAGWVVVTGTLVTKSQTGHVAILLMVSAVTLLLVSAQEELMCRGYVLTNLAEGLHWKRNGPRWAIALAVVLSAALFAVLHMLNPHTSTMSTLSAFLGGIVLALGYVLTGQLAIPIGFHTTWNLFQANVFGFPVSGEDLSSATLLATERGGPHLLVGDSFGPESGLLTIGAVVLGCLLIPLWTRLRYGSVGLHTAIARAPERLMKNASAQAQPTSPGRRAR
ncbi:MAG: lysostaphin resistance A-like protein [Planctomycetota bacterium]|jgi:membrane protease YdiL (CAAX protease family)